MSKKRNSAVKRKQDIRDFLDVEVPLDQEVDRSLVKSLSNRELYHRSDKHDDQSIPITLMTAEQLQAYEDKLDAIDEILNREGAKLNYSHAQDHEKNDIDNPYSVSMDHTHKFIPVNSTLKLIVNSQYKENDGSYDTETKYDDLDKRAMCTLSKSYVHEQIENFMLTTVFNATECIQFVIGSFIDKMKTEMGCTCLLIEVEPKNSETLLYFMFAIDSSRVIYVCFCLAIPIGEKLPPTIKEAASRKDNRRIIIRKQKDIADILDSKTDFLGYGYTFCKCDALH